jgi:Periplasmic glucan biosynthesis protein, MdoG
MSRASLKNWPRNHSSRRSPVPDVLKQLSYDDYRDIRFDSEQSLWKETGSNFQVHCLTERQREKWRPKGFVRAATDPYANLVHVGLLRGKIPGSGEARSRNRNLLEKMLKEGPTSFTPAERTHLLRDAESMAALHHRVWHMSHSDSEPAVTQADQASAIKDQAMLAVDRSPDAEAHWQST